MTDNFKVYRDFIDLPEDRHDYEKYYVIEIMRRGKDNPNMPAANVHYRNYYIYCKKDLDKYENEIKELCSIMRMRAYASVNYKLMSQVALNCVEEMTKRIAHHDVKRFYKVFDSVSSKYHNRKDNLWVIDADDVPSLQSEKLDKLVEVINKCKSTYPTKIKHFIKTRTGYHILTYPFDKRQFSDLCRIEQLGITSKDIKENHLTLLYENL